MNRSERLDRHPGFSAGALASLLAAGLVVSLTVSLPGCVSVEIAGKKADRSTGVQVVEPGAPFVRIASPQADGAWLNKANGNAISYLSTCHDPTDPSLDSAFTELIGSLESPKTIRTATETFNGREALEAEVAGLVDGVRTHVEVVIFKRNQCLYSLSYVGVEKSFAGDRARFQRFLDGFRAP